MFIAPQRLRRQLELYRCYAFGPRWERLIEAPGQGHLFELDFVESIPSPPEPPTGEYQAPVRWQRQLSWFSVNGTNESTR
jgi:hypothetical protein